MLRFDKVTIRQGDFSLSADFTVPAGRIVALLGPSGAGKSTLIDTVAGFLAPDSGRILWQGTDITPLPPAARPVSVLFQDNNLFPHLSVAQNVGLGLRPDLRLSADQHAAVSAALHRVGLQDLERRKPAALSGGQRSRVALARMLLRARPVMLLDEPFAALGPALKADMLRLVAELADETGATVLMVTHDPGDARAIAQDTALVDGGRVAPPRDTGTLLADPPPALRAYLG
ncbi:thiamine ABC transporter ATP-binding protein [Rhodovulum adriaticum]|uniref:Thiamine transport system ATP-binding protein n=1 Tax=Rhodovulum adriaticum TaxID=35804 RepID=A0A4R2P113_RHOAD|nr:ATP-binding cassette domain-containing protein [Rhodovulum adriaticum]MBK1635318.1 thiamine ABC transporter ATP-binding protein [Rhodovulum adriaticum]TCP27748.1 thiamine transport system ATP-binding protein [Rhodovulum adriaticum]